MDYGDIWTLGKSGDKTAMAYSKYLQVLPYVASEIGEPGSSVSVVSG
jgi:hypothetical protein